MTTGTRHRTDQAESPYTVGNGGTTTFFCWPAVTAGIL
jgi:hypothetical protein